MMAESLKMWADIEAKAGTKLLNKEGLMWIKDPSTPDFKQILDTDQGQLFTNEELVQKYPGFKHLPNKLQGYLKYEAGIIKSLEAL
jgi:hypothetical protein